MTTPYESYRADLEAPDFHYDQSQEAVALKLDRIYETIVRQSGFFARLTGRRTQVKGLYLWGGVGRGKTYLIDKFYECLPFSEKKRYHFHRFMSKTHQELKKLRDHRDPLPYIAERMAHNMKVLCFDEFVVNDIADAMILGGLLKGLIEHNVLLLATSNVRPDDLYKDGLQHDRFVPAIELIKQHTDVLEMNGDTDYRLQFLDRANTYFSPIDEQAKKGLQFNFCSIGGDGSADIALEIDGRDVATVRHANGIVWFAFDVICGSPRSQLDYLEIARCFHTVIVSDIPQLSDQDDDYVRRLINLVDVFYDSGVNLIVSAAVTPQELYTGTQLAGEFERTTSRLVEMQSRSYLARRHVA